MNWLTKKVNGKIIYFMDNDNCNNPRVIIRELPSGRYMLEDKLLGIQKKAANFERLMNNYLSEICVRSIELNFLQNNVKDISWGSYGDEDASYVREIYRFLVSSFSRSKKNRNRLIELDDGSFLFTWNFQGSHIEIYLEDKDDINEKKKVLNAIHSIFEIKEKELNNAMNLLKGA